MLRGMFVAALIALASVPQAAFATESSGTREFRAAAGGKLTLLLEAGAEVKIAGTGGSSVTVTYKLSCTPECRIEFDQTGNEVSVKTRFASGSRSQTADSAIDIRVPRQFDIALDSMGGRLEIDGVKGDFTGETKGGEITLHDVDGVAKLRTMGGEISITDSTLDGSVQTMGGAVTIENVVGDVKGSSMGGDIAIDSVDGWVQATSMGGNLDVTVTRAGGDVTLTSMSGKAVLHVPRGFGMNLDLEVAFTKNSLKEYTITAPGSASQTVTPDWDYGQGSPRKYIRKSGSVNGGGQKVTVKTVNGNITVVEGS